MKKGELIRHEIEPASDGTAIGRVHVKAGAGKNKGPWLSDRSEQMHTYASPEEAGKHVTEMLRQNFGKDMEPTTKAADRKQWGNPKDTGKSEPMSDDGPNAQMG